MVAEQLAVGIICEGPTDRVVLRDVITSYTGDKNILFTPLIPAEDGSGNWDMVVKYCASDNFKEFLTSTDSYAVLHIDTDWLLGDSVPEAFRIPQIAAMEPQDVLAAMKEILVQQMGQEFYDAYIHRIIFAIAVHQTECWFLALYYSEKQAAKTVNCLDYLNKKLQADLGFTIHGKELDYYRTLCKPFKKKKALLEYSKANHSFNAFIEELSGKLLLLEDEETAS